MSCLHICHTLLKQHNAYGKSKRDINEVGVAQEASPFMDTSHRVESKLHDRAFFHPVHNHG